MKIGSDSITVSSKNEYKPYAYIKAFTKDSLNNLSVKLVKGKLPENENEIVIPTHLQTNGRLFLNIGDSITLDIGKRIDNSNYELNQNNPYQKTDEENGESIVETISKTYKIVGIIDLRHTLNDFLKDFGNCGYSVRPSERKKGYATEMLRQILNVAKDSNMSELHLSVERDNEPSIKTILANGGVYERSFVFENEMADIYKIEI